MEVDQSGQQHFVLRAFDQHERSLTAYAVRLYRGDLHAARDAVQHTFLKLVQQNSEKVEHKIAPWLFTVCRNWVIDDLRRRAKSANKPNHHFDMVDGAATDPAANAEQADLLQRIYERIETLDDPLREVMELWSHGLATKEIAEVLDQKPGTVRVNLHRSIKRLRQDPLISNWLERATGQVDWNDTQRVEPAYKRTTAVLRADDDE